MDGSVELDGAVNIDGAVDMDSTLDVAGHWFFRSFLYKGETWQKMGLVLICEREKNTITVSFFG